MSVGVGAATGIVTCAKVSLTVSPLLARWPESGVWERTGPLGPKLVCGGGVAAVVPGSVPVWGGVVASGVGLVTMAVVVVWPR